MQRMLQRLNLPRPLLTVRRGSTSPSVSPSPSGAGENEKSQKPRFFVGFGKAGRRLIIFYMGYAFVVLYVKQNPVSPSPTPSV